MCEFVAPMRMARAETRTLFRGLKDLQCPDSLLPLHVSRGAPRGDVAKVSRSLHSSEKLPKSAVFDNSPFCASTWAESLELVLA